MAKKQTAHKSSPKVQPVNQVQLFGPEDTIINCNTPDGSVISVDAMDLDQMVAEVHLAHTGKETIPYNTFLSEMVAKFEVAYGFRMSKQSMDILIRKKQELLDNVKKNT